MSLLALVIGTVALVGMIAILAVLYSAAAALDWAAGHEDHLW